MHSTGIFICHTIHVYLLDTDKAESNYRQFLNVFVSLYWVPQYQID